MGDVVEFQFYRNRHSRTPERTPEGGAQILFFLGVRYERHEAPQTQSLLKKRSRSASKPAKRRKSRRQA